MKYLSNDNNNYLRIIKERVRQNTIFYKIYLRDNEHNISF